MRKDFGVMPAVYPMPVLMIATYDENGVVDVMNAAWGMVCESDKLTLALSESHKTVKNIKINKAFTVGLADAKTVKEADYFGIASGNDTPGKFEKTGLTAVRSERVNAPVIEEFPVTFECELAEIVRTENFRSVVGRIINVSVDESVLGADGKVDVDKAGILIFNQFDRSYRVTGEKVGEAWSSGMELK